MLTLYILSALVGSVILILLMILNLIGIGGHGDFGFHDAPHDLHLDAGAHLHDVSGAAHAHDPSPDHGISTVFFHILSLRAIVSAIAFFGFGGMIALQAGYGTGTSVISGVCGGVIAMFIVAWLMNLLYSLWAEGNVNIANTLGTPANVYLAIPAARGGLGKITVAVQERSMEYDAMTDETEAIITGERVVVSEIINENTVAVKRTTN